MYWANGGHMFISWQGSRQLSLIILTSLLYLGACADSGGGAQFQISGTISVEPNTFLDVDVNDTYAPAQYHGDNDTSGTAQQIQNPAKVGGYANASYGGYSGSSYVSGDYNDYYRVTLTENETITLYISDINTGSYGGDLNLYLYAVSAPTTVVASSTGTTSVETVTVPAAGSGDYFILVQAVVGGSNYLLTVGNVGINSHLQKSLIYDDFIPGELIVRFKPGFEETGKGAMQIAGLSVYGGGQRQAHLVSFQSQSQRDLAFQNLGVSRPNKHQGKGGIGVINTAEELAKRDTVLLLYALRQRDDIESVDVNYRRKATALPDDPYLGRMWNLPAIGIPSVWNNTSYTGAGVTVAVIDTGILSSHPDLSGRISIDGYDFISSAANALDGDGIDNNPEDLGDGSGTPYPSSFHGTHVSGTIAATGNNTKGIAGIAYGATILPLRVLGKYGGTDYDIIQAMYYAAQLTNDSGTTPTNGADIINMSLGGPGYSSSFQAAIDAVRSAGVIVVAAAGNESSSTKSYPAAYNGVVAVSAIDQNKSLAWYSNYGQASDNWIDIAAPGGDTRVDLDGDGNPDGVLSTLGDDSGGSIVLTYDYYQGTSMAAPHVAGVIALMLEANPAMTPADLDSWLPEIVDDLGATGKDIYYGTGLVNAVKAVHRADGTTTFPATIALSHQNITFTPGMTGFAIKVDNSGTTPLTIDSIVESSGGWLSVAATNIDANGLGTYQLNVERTSLADGEYNATITFATNTVGVSDAVVNVSLKVGFIGSEDAGYHYLVVVDAQLGYSVAYVELLPNNGVYQYSVGNIPAGSYFIVAGTDMNNNFYFCDEGEACGSYSASPLRIDGNKNGLDFTTGFLIPLTATQVGGAADAPMGYRKE